MSQLTANPPASTPIAIIVMGVSGCGKSTLGALLAHALSCPFLEGDSFHSAQAVAKMRAGQALTDDDRWPWLHRLGRASASAMVQHGAVVTACSALRLCYRDILRSAIGDAARFVMLDNSRDRIMERMRSRIDHYMPTDLLDSQLSTLERPHQMENAIILSTDAPPGQLRENVLAWLGR